MRRALAITIAALSLGGILAVASPAQAAPPIKKPYPVKCRIQIPSGLVCHWVWKPVHKHQTNPPTGPIYR